MGISKWKLKNIIRKEFFQCFSYILCRFVGGVGCCNDDCILDIFSGGIPLYTVNSLPSTHSLILSSNIYFVYSFVKNMIINV
jgi:hypothetical protein